MLYARTEEMHSCNGLSDRRQTHQIASIVTLHVARGSKKFVRSGYSMMLFWLLSDRSNAPQAGQYERYNDSCILEAETLRADAAFPQEAGQAGIQACC
jgi:hypothetical protein